MEIQTPMKYERPFFGLSCQPLSSSGSEKFFFFFRGSSEVAYFRYLSREDCNHFPVFGQGGPSRRYCCARSINFDLQRKSSPSLSSNIKRTGWWQFNISSVNFNTKESWKYVKTQTLCTQLPSYFWSIQEVSFVHIADESLVLANPTCKLPSILKVHLNVAVSNLLGSHFSCSPHKTTLHVSFKFPCHYTNG